MSYIKSFKSWVVKKKLILFVLVFSFLPVLYVLIKRFFKIDTVLDLKGTIDFDW